MNKKITTPLIIALCVLFAQTSSSAPELQPRRQTPVIMGLMRSPSGVSWDIPSVLGGANLALIRYKIDTLKRYIGDGDPDGLDARLKQELAAWNEELRLWKKGDPAPKGVSYIVIVEAPEGLWVSYYAVNDKPFVCLLDKKSYAPKNVEPGSALDAFIVTTP